MLATLAPYIVVLFTATLAALAALTIAHVVEHLDSSNVSPLPNGPAQGDV
jgi:hypothetical protein